MSELKTLKNLRYGNADTCDCEQCDLCVGDDHAISENALRQEAIKWIKELPKAYYLENDLVRNWIKHFFNIEESDLK